jgi:hypothetical protein
VKGNEEGASELIDETLIIAMGLVLAVVTLMLISGVIPLTEKTAYLVPQFGVGNVSGHTVIRPRRRTGLSERIATGKIQGRVVCGHTVRVV